jgi:hypothetical protein
MHINFLLIICLKKFYFNIVQKLRTYLAVDNKAVLKELTSQNISILYEKKHSTRCTFKVINEILKFRRNYVDILLDD